MFSLVVCNTNEVKSPLATLDPRSRAAPGLTASKCLCSEFESLLISVSSYFLHGLLVYEIIPASSARFPCLNIQSRDRSPPSLKLEGKETYIFHRYVIVKVILNYLPSLNRTQKLGELGGGGLSVRHKTGKPKSMKKLVFVTLRCAPALS